MEYTYKEVAQNLQDMMQCLQNLHHARMEFHAAYRMLVDSVRNEELLAAEDFVRFMQNAEDFEDTMIQRHQQLQKLLELWYRETPPLPPDHLE